MTLLGRGADNLTLIKRYGSAILALDPARADPTL